MTSKTNGTTSMAAAGPRGSALDASNRSADVKRSASRTATVFISNRSRFWSTLVAAGAVMPMLRWWLPGLSPRPMVDDRRARANDDQGHEHHEPK